MAIGAKKHASMKIASGDSSAAQQPTPPFAATKRRSQIRCSSRRAALSLMAMVTLAMTTAPPRR